MTAKAKEPKKIADILDVVLAVVLGFFAGSVTGLLLAGCGHRAAAPAVVDVVRGQQHITFVADATVDTVRHVGKHSVVELHTRINDYSVSNAIDQLNSHPDAVLEINSEGGELTSAIAMVRYLEGHRDITCAVDGHAESAASIIFTACAHRYILKRSVLMLHEVACEEGDDSRPTSTALQNRAGECLAATNAMIAIYAHHTHATAAELTRRIGGGKEWWLGWTEARAWGLADAAVDELNEIWTRR